MSTFMFEVDHRQQRYPTCGDWLYDCFKNLIIYVSHMPDWRFVFLVMFHELIEAALCKLHKIPEQDVTKFDLWFETQQLEGEPGDHPRAPYRRQHQTATKFEMMMAEELGVNWQEYEQAIDDLFKEAANGKQRKSTSPRKTRSARKQPREQRGRV